MRAHTYNKVVVVEMCYQLGLRRYLSPKQQLQLSIALHVAKCHKNRNNTLQEEVTFQQDLVTQFSALKETESRKRRRKNIFCTKNKLPAEQFLTPLNPYFLVLEIACRQQRNLERAHKFFNTGIQLILQ